MLGGSELDLGSYNIWEDLARDFYFNAPPFKKRNREYFGKAAHPWRSAPRKKSN